MAGCVAASAARGAQLIRHAHRLVALSSLLLVCLLCPLHDAIDNGLGLTPPLVSDASELDLYNCGGLE